MEDDDELRTELCDLLDTDGFDVLSAGNGADGLKLLRENPDVRAIVLDVSMPVMNGATFRGEQLSDDTIASIPVILLTGREDMNTLALTLATATCIKKPGGEALLRAVEQYR